MLYQLQTCQQLVSNLQLFNTFLKTIFISIIDKRLKSNFNLKTIFST